MASNDPVRARRQPRPAKADPPTDDAPRVGTDPGYADTRSGATVPPSGTRPDAASPVTTPHAVINREGPQPGYEPEAITRAEADARRGTGTGTGTDIPHAGDREEGGLRHERVQAPGKPPRNAVWYVLAILAVVVVALLIRAL